MPTAQQPMNRLDRRKARTRQALIDAARAFLAEHGMAEVSIQDLTEAADVGFGSFYNHFTSKSELFHAAIAEVLEEHGQLLDEVTAGIEDPAEVFATSVRKTARLIWTHPQMARILAQTGLSYLTSEKGLVPRALRDIKRGVEAGRFHVDNPYVAVATTAGSLHALINLWLGNPELVDEAACDELTEQVLRMLGMTRRSAHAIVNRPLPQG
ncbi:TetR/AcrR family transcriptional regulator [Streptomyces cucumeris]|uniref:TetR/AcrR family transcriptional regulator n=1 Tax=Streptomyces TaxID=1883 RepID=UPI0020C8F7F7|nr:TetR/AcrR family transcriptional regulator [Streptomyces sp. NEAU-Y11]MCP9210375.1 TetR/AcrR family transcriptional regulator [Streptomyces sp. NEAU-Y11]